MSLLPIGLVAATLISGCAVVAREAAAQALTMVAVDMIDDAPFTDPVGGHGTVLPVAWGGSRSGDTPGLYGGTRNATSCDKRRLTAFLGQNAAKGRAWASALGVDYATLDEYIGELTPALLRSDTLVKNHGFKNGKANAFNAVLQAGLAVLLDQYGTPAVLCRCGNPLTASGGSIDFHHLTGKPWKKKPSKENVTVVKPRKTGVPFFKKKTPLKAFALNDPQTGGLFEREPGTSGQHDRPIPVQSPVPSQSPDPSDTGSPLPSGTITPAPTPIETPTGLATSTPTPVLPEATS